MQIGAIRAAGVAAALVCALAGVGRAGDLNPPPGPIGDTGPRILSQATTPPPINIVEPGPYILTSDLIGPQAENAINILVSDVSIDLNGFAMRGGPGTLNAIAAIVGQTGDINNISVRNGVIKDFRNNGVSLGGARNCIIEDMRVQTSTFAGIVAGINSVVRDCVTIQNGAQGILANDGSTVIGCASSLNFAEGFAGSQGVTFVSCVSYENLSFGFNGLAGTNVRGCTAFQNDASGINVSQGSLVINCTSHLNLRFGVVLDDECYVMNTATYANGSGGIQADRNCYIYQCASGNNSGPGVTVGAYCVVRDCLAVQNGGLSEQPGIEARGSNAWIDSNASIRNTRFGILAVGIDNVITRNYLQDNEINLEAISGNQIGTEVSTPVGAGPWEKLNFPP